MPQLQPEVSHWGALEVEDVYLQDLKVYTRDLQAARNKTNYICVMGWLPEELNTDLAVQRSQISILDKKSSGNKDSADEPMLPCAITIVSSLRKACTAQVEVLSGSAGR